MDLKKTENHLLPHPGTPAMFQMWRRAHEECGDAPASEMQTVTLVCREAPPLQER